MKSIVIVILTLLGVLTFGAGLWGMYQWGHSSSQQEYIELKNEEYKKQRKRLDEAIRTAPSTPDAALERLRQRAQERGL